MGNMKEVQEPQECFQTIIDNEEFSISEDMKNKLENYKENLPEFTYENNLNGKVFSSHEGLLLRYEECFIRKINEKFYNLSADFLLIGERTNNIDGAHLEFFRGLENPIGIKIISRINIEDLIKIIKTLNPLNSL